MQHGLGGQQKSQARGEVAVRPCKGGPGRVGACNVLLAWPGEEPSPAATPRPSRAAVPSPLQQQGPLRSSAPGQKPPPWLVPAGTYFGQE